MTAGRGNAGLEQPAQLDERNLVFRIAEDDGVDADWRQHLGRFGTQVAKDLGKLCHYADTMLSFFHVGSPRPPAADAPPQVARSKSPNIVG
jgi:hypothetical protein